MGSLRRMKQKEEEALTIFDRDDAMGLELADAPCNSGIQWLQLLRPCKRQWGNIIKSDKSEMKIPQRQNRGQRTYVSVCVEKTMDAPKQKLVPSGVVAFVSCVRSDDGR